ncbi:MAG: GFA family protein [Burkholderiaceae bacterium]
MKGSCLCGAVSYEVDQLDGPIGHCHCASCQKANAAAFTTTAKVDREHFRWVTGAELVSAFESSEGKHRHFCSRCGSHLIAERAAQSHVVLRVATLNDDPGQTPASHFWKSHDRHWLVDTSETQDYQEWPPGR